MEAKYKSLSLSDLFLQYPDHERCLQRLADYKWRDGYCCKRCDNTRFCAGDRLHSRQCTKCHYIESATANTLFHKIKFPLDKAFAIIYFVGNGKQGISSTELARKLQLRQKTCWLFKQKVMKAMSSSGTSMLTGEVEVREFIFGQYKSAEKTAVKGSRKRKSLRKKKLGLIAIERRGDGASRIYGRVIEKASAQEIDAFMSRVIDSDAKVICTGWPGYKPLKAKFEAMVQSTARENGNNQLPLKHRALRILHWLRGTHGHAERLQGYLDEFSYRYNRCKVEGGLLESLIDRMMSRPPCPYKALYCLNAYSNFETNPDHAARQKISK